MTNEEAKRRIAEHIAKHGGEEESKRAKERLEKWQEIRTSQQ